MRYWGHVGVLELVDQDVLIPLLVAVQHLWESVEQLRRLEEQVVEIDGVVPGQQLLVVPVGAGAELLEVAVGVAGHCVGAAQHALGAGDRAQHRAGRVLFRVDFGQLHRLLDHGGLVAVVIDGVVVGEAEVVAFLPQKAGAEGVEGADGQSVAAVAHQAPQPVAHFAGRLVGEGHGQDAVGAHAAGPHQVSDAVGDDASLAAARPGNDKQRAVDSLDRFPLRRVQPLQYIRNLSHVGIIYDSPQRTRRAQRFS